LNLKIVRIFNINTKNENIKIKEKNEKNEKRENWKKRKMLGKTTLTGEAQSHTVRAGRIVSRKGREIGNANQIVVYLNEPSPQQPNTWVPNNSSLFFLSTLID
jgi:hypothetical protein